MFVFRPHWDYASIGLHCSAPALRGWVGETPILSYIQRGHCIYMYEDLCSMNFEMSSKPNAGVGIINFYWGGRGKGRLMCLARSVELSLGCLGRDRRQWFELVPYGHVKTQEPHYVRWNPAICGQNRLNLWRCTLHNLWMRSICWIDCHSDSC